MMSRGEEAAVSPRRHAIELTDAVLENMRQNLERLKYSTLVPSRYVVYVHPSEYRRLEGILPVIRQQTIRALAEQLQTLNRPAAWKRLVPAFVGAVTPGTAPVENAASDWFVEFVPDPNDELQDGDVLVESELLLPALPELGAGEGTRRVTTRLSADGTVRDSRTESHPTEPIRALARLTYDDDNGRHHYEMVTGSITIGRGRIAEPVDVPIASSADVSRVHARIRFDSASGQFFLTDLSSLGTTLNDRHVPSGYEDAGGVRQPTGHETVLPSPARIGLADTVFLQFEIVR
jgi:hypothetical protein